MSKILITGGAGYIGSHTVSYLISQGVAPDSIVVFDNLERGHKEFLPTGVELIVGDLQNFSEIESVFLKDRIEGVIHFAALAYVGESMIEPGRYFSNNISGGINLLEAMRSGECKRIIFSSTCSTYGLAKTETIAEDHQQTPINPYGESKLTFEKILHWYDDIYDIRYVALRYFNAAGADFNIGEWHEPETHLLPIAIEANLGVRDVLEIFGDNYQTPDGTCIRDYIHVTDLAEAHSLAYKYLSNGGKSSVFNLGTAQGASVKQVVAEIERVSGHIVPVKISPSRPGDPAILVANADKAKTILNWAPQRSLGEIVESAWLWHKTLSNKLP